MDTIIINVVTPPDEPVEVIVSSIGEVGPPGPPGETTGTLNYIIDGGASVISLGLKSYVEWSFNALITGWTILGDMVGSIEVDIWKDSYGNYPPTLADSITGTEKPTLSTVIKNQNLSLSSFNATVTAGDIWAFNVDSVTDIKKVTLAFRFNKT